MILWSYTYFLCMKRICKFGGAVAIIRQTWQHCMQLILPSTDEHFFFVHVYISEYTFQNLSSAVDTSILHIFFCILTVSTRSVWGDLTNIAVQKLIITTIMQVDAGVELLLLGKLQLEQALVPSGTALKRTVGPLIIELPWNKNECLQGHLRLSTIRQWSKRNCERTIELQ